MSADLWNGTVSLPFAVLIIAVVIALVMVSTAIGARLWDRRSR